MYYIYLVFNQINNKLYVGKSKNPSVRFGVHKSIARGGPEIYKGRYHYFHRAIKKHGPENFLLQIVDSSENESEIFKKETYWINLLKSLDYKLYNVTEGGEGPTGYKHTESTKILMSQNHKYRYGEDHPLYGIGHTEETKQKMSKISKQKNQNVGNKNPMFGKTGRNAPAFGRTGEKHPNYKISDNDINILREEIKSGNFLLKDLAKNIMYLLR